MQGLKHESPFSHSSRSGDHRQHNWQYIDLQICFSLYVVLIFLNKEIVNLFLKILHLDTTTTNNNNQLYLTRVTRDSTSTE